MTDEYAATVKRNCARTLSWYKTGTMRETLTALAGLEEADGPPDVYGEGGPVAVLERETAALLGKPAARFVVKATIAQQTALRVWCDRSGSRLVAVHPRSHIDADEGSAYELLHGLRGVRLGDTRPFTVADLDGVVERLGAVTVELPLRGAGYRLPTWDELTGISAWCRTRGIPLHFDGARMWEATTYYGRPLHEIADLADSVYVSFYKGIGGLAGCAIAGEPDLLTAMGPWLDRHGAGVYALYPYALSALDGLRRMLPAMPARVARARSLAAALTAVEGVRVAPEPPQTNGFRVYLPGEPAALERAHLALAEETSVWLFGRFTETEPPGLTAVEVEIHEGAATLTDDEVVVLVKRLLEQAGN
ncbi:threonine aldolase family protein [Rhizohabitans arisaemae]|uniref:threonine aldolase family protein n=1 Tax=Rhizohabitans arisaemae TaxID=2720610 RepID=UPI0024B1337F|nr:beta-eliminating lyase-related protein [Rhizohabitans arisaemae]